MYKFCVGYIKASTEFNCIDWTLKNVNMHKIFNKKQNYKKPLHIYIL